MDLYELYRIISSRSPHIGETHFEYRENLGYHRTRYLIPDWLEIPGYSNVWVSNRKINKIIATIEMTDQMFYDIVFLGITSPDDRPRCKCGNELVFYGLSNGYELYCDRACSSRYREIKDSTRKKLSEINMGHEVSQETRDKISKKVKGLPSPTKGKKSSLETRRKISDARLRFAEEKRRLNPPDPNKPKKKKFSEMTEEEKKVVREERSRRRREYLDSHPEAICSNGVRGFKFGWYYLQRFDINVRYLSSWELRFLEFLETYDEVLEFNKPPKIPYYNPKKQKECWYFPDYLLKLTDGTDVLVEIKPKSLVGSDVVKAKTEKAIEFCSKVGYVYLILTEDDLFINVKSGDFNNKLSLITKIRSNQSDE